MPDNSQIPAEAVLLSCAAFQDAHGNVSEETYWQCRCGHAEWCDEGISVHLLLERYDKHRRMYE